VKKKTETYVLSGAILLIFLVLVLFPWTTNGNNGPPPPPPPGKGVLEVRCYVGELPHAPDDAKVIVNGTTYYTDSNGRWYGNFDAGVYFVYSTYKGEIRSELATVIENGTILVEFEWQSISPPSPPLFTIPSTVIHVIDEYGVAYPIINTAVQRKNFYAAGLYWQTWSKETMSTGIFYKTSSDGTIWSEERKMIGGNVDFPDFYSLCLSGNDLHITYAGYYGVWYRKGTPLQDGTVSWVAPLQTINHSLVEGYFCCDPTICVDSGYPWIGFYWEVGAQKPMVIKSSKNDGTWEMAPGFPFLLNENLGHRGVGVVSLTNNKVYALYYRAFKTVNIQMPSGVIYGRLWDGASWGPQEQVTISHVEQQEFHQLSFVSYLDEVHLVFLKKDTAELVYVRRTSNGWQNEIVIEAVSSKRVNPTVSFSQKTESLYCFWADGLSAYYKRMVSGVWNQKSLIATEIPIGVCDVIDESKIISSEREANGKICIAWLLGYMERESLLRCTLLEES